MEGGYESVIRSEDFHRGLSPDSLSTCPVSLAKNNNYNKGSYYMLTKN